jgi:hypothetical protein
MFLQQPKLSISCSSETHHIWVGTLDEYSDARHRAGGVLPLCSPIHEIVQMDINQLVLTCYTVSTCSGFSNLSSY